MRTLFAAAYLAPRKRPLAQGSQRVVSGFRAACAENRFPFDIADDPAFFAAHCLGSPVTWGVCRPDVRTMIRPGDYAAFFAADREDQQTRYLFVGAFCVERKLSHASLWEDRQPFRDYLNLLIRPRGQGWEHFEPALAKHLWHKDWLWRISGNTGRRKESVFRASLSHVAGQPLPYPPADTYVVFSSRSSAIPPSPILVATHSGGAGVETWLTTQEAGAIRRLIYSGTARGIRTRNRHQPHRHFRRSLENPGEFRELLGRAWAAHTNEVSTPR
jgi:hypothetical protein